MYDECFANDYSFVYELNYFIFIMWLKDIERQLRQSVYEQNTT